MARLDTGAVHLITRNGNNLARRFPFIAMAVAALPARSCLIDGETIMCDESGLAVFDLIRGHRPSATAVHCAFDLLELDGEDLRRQPIEVRKALLADLLHGAHSTIVVNDTRSSLLHPAALPPGSLTLAEALLIDAEILFRQPGPPQSLEMEPGIDRHEAT